MHKKSFLIGFVGSPYSGKTTTAALLFGELKKAGIQVEYLPEYARDRIREMKDLNPNFKLNDAVQMHIRDIQQKLEERHLNHNGDGAITITDGSTANSHFYNGSDDLEYEINRYDILFFSRNIEERSATDENRVHDVEFSRQMETKVLSSLNMVCPLLKTNIVELNGDIDARLGKAMYAVSKLLKKENNQ
jgi:ABC-type oligopeptide transport system ATPase subunit